MGIELKSAGSLTLKCQALAVGIDPDNCYYIQNEPKVRSQSQIDLKNDPLPDLAIEVDITSNSVNKLEIYAALGVPELWLYNGRILKFYQLVEWQYNECEFSLF